jgi:hypothetical protein
MDFLHTIGGAASHLRDWNNRGRDFVGDQYGAFMASEHRSNDLMSQQLAAAPGYAVAHGRPSNPWAAWADATGLSAVGRTALKVNNAVGHALTQPIPNFVPDELSHNSVYKAILGNPAGLGGVAHDLTDPLQGLLQHPSLAAGLQAAAMAPVPWGARGGRTAPALPRGERMKQQVVKDFHRDASQSIAAAPELGAGTQWVNDSMQELRMRELGLSKREILQRRVDTLAGRRATMDQLLESTRGLESLLPDASIVPLLPAGVKSHLVETLMKTRKVVEDKMALQQQGNARGEPMRSEHMLTAPQRIEMARNRVEAILAQHLGNAAVGDREQIAAAIKRLGNYPGRNLDQQHYGMH